MAMQFFWQKGVQRQPLGCLVSDIHMDHMVIPPQVWDQVPWKKLIADPAAISFRMPIGDHRVAKRTVRHR